MGKLEKKVVVELSVGLGNQLFQYALAKYLAISNNKELVIDLTRSIKDAITDNMLENIFDLKYFNFTPKFWSGPNISEPEKLSFCQRKKYQRNYIKIKEELFVINNQTNKKFHKNIHVIGYWQNEKYFKQIEDTIRNDLQIKPEVIKKFNPKNTANINKSNSISIHIRRSDYIDDTGNIKIYKNIYNSNYYTEAVKYFDDKINTPIYYVFSDDIKWCIDNFKIQTTNKLIFIESASAIEDFYLMSLCKNNIIANSTFSWWAAWLNSNKNKTIISPETWFINGWNDSNIAPSNWIKIKS